MGIIDEPASNVNWDDGTDGDAWVDETFAAMIDADESLASLLGDLEAVGIVVPPEKRHIVVKWLDMFSLNTPIPLAKRLAMLRGWLSA